MKTRAEGAAHLSPGELGGYLDDDLPPAERHRVEVHLADCAQCRGELADVRRTLDARRRRWIVGLVPALAAALLLAVALPRRAPSPSDAPAATRGDAVAERRVEIVAPSPSTDVPPRAITFAWRSAGPDASYSLTLQEADGRVVWSTDAVDTVAILPDSIVLARGRTWFWSVDAILPDGRAASSGLHRLSTRP